MSLEEIDVKFTVLFVATCIFKLDNTAESNCQKE